MSRDRFSAVIKTPFPFLFLRKRLEQSFAFVLAVQRQYPGVCKNIGFPGTGFLGFWSRHGY